MTPIHKQIQAVMQARLDAENGLVICNQKPEMYSTSIAELNDRITALTDAIATLNGLQGLVEIFKEL